MRHQWWLFLAAWGLTWPLMAEPNYNYDDFESDEVCADCHVNLVMQHKSGMMSQSFTHVWDEAEYYELALPHAAKDSKVAGIKAGCNGCHAPLAFLTGDIPPKRPSKGTRANEGVSCDVCHSITGFKGEVPYNFNFVIDPKGAIQGTRAGVKSSHHGIKVNNFLKSAEYCGVCHNEKDPYDQWVKATHLEWKQSPQGKAGIVCQDCHMPKARFNPAPDGDGSVHEDARMHGFHGSHSMAKLKGSVEIELYSEDREVKPGSKVVLHASVMNAKAGHMIPSGSAEERVVWLHVEAKDSAGHVYHIPVDPKGFKGEEWTIASDKAMAYQDIGDAKGLKDFKGLKRDGVVPAGDRIFRLPYLDPKGRMTVLQWNTASFGPDYRLAPLESKLEQLTWSLPNDIAPGPVQITAKVYYSRVVSSVAEYMKLPKEEYEPIEISSAVLDLVVKGKR